MAERTVLIGLTGGIGAGKSVVARILRSRGFEVYDCDLHAKQLMEFSEELRTALTERFGRRCYDSGGCLNRAFLAERIFSSSEDRVWVNALVHEAVRKDIEERRRSGGVPGGVLFVESAILHSSHLDERCRAIWIVSASEEIRFSRALQRGGIGEANLRARMEAQRRELDSMIGEKTVIIDNSGSESLLDQIDAAFETLIILSPYNHSSEA